MDTSALYCGSCRSVVRELLPWATPACCLGCYKVDHPQDELMQLESRWVRLADLATAHFAGNMSMARGFRDAEASHHFNGGPELYASIMAPFYALVAKK